MRRTGQNPRRTGQRGGNRGENESGFFRQEDPPTKRQLRRDEAESERRKTAADGMEGQRPRLTHFSATGGAEIATANQTTRAAGWTCPR
jgi:hypothetical protein